MTRVKMSDQKKVCFRIEAYHVKVNRSHVPVEESHTSEKRNRRKEKEAITIVTMSMRNPRSHPYAIRD
jgi:endo-beta-N-acetylglucosaminidase D